MSNSSIRNISLLGFVNEVQHIHQKMPDRRFCFVLGAGASRMSGIPTAGELALDWLRRLHAEQVGAPVDFVKWLESGAHGIQGLSAGVRSADVASIAAAYSEIYEAKWGHDRAQGYAEIEHKIESAKPSYGYYALAEILATEDSESPSRHNVVITPNFDNLPAEALGALGKRIPIVIGHSAIAAFARPTLRRPLIIKFHHDFLLSPKSNPSDVDTLDDGFSKALSEFFRLYTPIVIGYGGNDGSLMGLLEGLKESIPGGIFWCWRKGDPPGQRIRDIVVKHGGAMIEIPGFDELMGHLQKSFGRAFQPNSLTERANQRSLELTAAQEELRKRTEFAILFGASSGEQMDPVSASEIKAKLSAESSALLDALSEVGTPAASANLDGKDTLPWWHWLNRINATSDLDEKERLFEEGLKASQSAPLLLGSYADFLAFQRNNHQAAEDYYNKALAADPSNAALLLRYALFLHMRRNEFDRAEEYYRKVIDADPNYASGLGNYAHFLANQRKDYAGAEIYYRRAISADPNDANQLGNFVQFLIGSGRFDEASPLAIRAWEQLGNRHNMTAAEVAFSRWLLSVVAGFNGDAALGRLKTLLDAGYPRLPWTFDTMLEACLPKLKDRQGALARKLAAAILDGAKLLELSADPGWISVNAIPIDESWPPVAG